MSAATAVLLVQGPVMQPRAISPCEEYEQRSIKLQESTERAIARLSPASVVQRTGAQLVAAKASLALMQEYSCGPQPAVTAGAVDRQFRFVQNTAEKLSVLLLNRLNGNNSMPGLAWTSLPQWQSLGLIQACLDRGCIRADGEPVMRQQPAQPYRVSLAEFLTIERQRSIIGRIDSVFGDSDMIVVPDAFPWIHVDDLADMASCAVLPVTRCSTAAYTAWFCQLVKHMPQLQLLAVQLAAARPVFAAATAAVSAYNAACGMHSSDSCALAGYGGSGTGSRPTAVGSGDEGQRQQGAGGMFVPARAVCRKASRWFTCALCSILIFA